MFHKFLNNVKVSTTNKSFLILFIIITLILIQIKSQCPESCLICTNSTYCTSCVSQSNIILVNSSLGCLPCPSSCQKCVSQNSSKSCTTCSSGYYPDVSTSACIRCEQQNCKKCNIYSPKQCQECESGYFLQQSTSSCKSCSRQYLHSKTCRQNFIYTCDDGYYTSNGQLCSICSSNLSCKICPSPTLCTQCFDGFYLSNSKCLSCGSTCKTCITSTSCSTCNKGYRINTSSKCQICTTSNCASCTILDICQQCVNGYYFDNQNKVCISFSQNNNSKIIDGCMRYANNYNFVISSLFISTSILCRSCVNGTYLNVQTNSCQYCSLLCSSCSGIYRSSKCMSCIQEYGRLSDSVNGICNPKIYTENGEKVFYLNNRNNADNYTRSNSNIKNVAEGILKCPGGVLSFQTSVDISSIVGFRYNFTIKLLLSTTNISPYYLNAYFNQVFIYQQVIVQSSSSTTSTNTSSIKVCNQLKISTFSFILESSSAHNITSLVKSGKGIKNMLKLNSTSSNLMIDIRQMIVLLKQCHQTCGLCQHYEKCYQCKNESQYLQEQMCVYQCSNGYYFNQIGKQCVLQCPKSMYPFVKAILWTCQLCNAKCSACLDYQMCTSCVNGYYLYNNSCSSFCPTTYFANLVFNKCQKCTSPCYQCTSTRFCLSCVIGFHFNGNNSCLNDCPEGFYGNLMSMQCLACQYPCYSCSKTALQCLSCVADSFNLTFFDGQCLSKCPSQYFTMKNSLNSQLFCGVCQFPCFQCINASDKCTSCITGFLLSSSNTCQQSCPLGYFSSKTYMQCITCQQPCYGCIYSQKLCTSCINGGAYYLNVELKSCTLGCQYGYYPNKLTNICNKCPLQCTSCISSVKCSSCADNYYLQNNQSCLLQCLNGFYKNQIQTNNLTNNVTYISNICSLCSSNCKLCFGQQDYCLQCYDYFFLQTNNTCSSQCLQTQLFPGCSQCQYPCYSCSKTQDNCTSCQNNYYYYSPNNQCVSQCYIGYYKNIDKGYGYCVQCIQPCINCLNPNICYQCQAMNGIQYYLKTISVNYKKCVVNCSIYQFKQKIQNICMSCQSPCLTCLNLTYCLSCQNGILVNGNCLSKVDGCPIGNYQTNTILQLTQGITITNVSIITCIKCPIKCSACKSPTLCTSCSQDFYLLQTNCLDHCPSGTAPIKQLRKCIYCQYPCIQCDSLSTNCTKCGYISLLLSNTLINSTNLTANSPNGLVYSPGVICPENRIYNYTCIKYYLYNGQCMPQCSSFAYPKNDKCVNCISPCLTCQSQSICTSCVSNTFMLQTQCYLNCPQQYYKQPFTQQCQKCIYPCRVCLNGTFCLQCREGFLFQGVCLIKDDCPVGYFQSFRIGTASANDKYCEKCNESCIACVDSSLFCSQCVSPYSLFLGLCYDSCPDGYYTSTHLSLYLPSTRIYSCQKCQQQCLICSSPAVCRQCSYSYYLLQNRCVAACPSNCMERQRQIQFHDVGSNQIVAYTTSACSLCTQPCLSCFLEEYLCQSCVPGYYIYNSKCVRQCPSQNGTYLNKLTQSCKECQFPCRRCIESQEGDVICQQCILGYYILSINIQTNSTVETANTSNTANNINLGVCVDQCRDWQYISTDKKKCVNSCGDYYSVLDMTNSHNNKFCLTECKLPYVTDHKNKRCVSSCQQLLQQENENSNKSQNSNSSSIYYLNSKYECTSFNSSNASFYSSILSLTPTPKYHLYISSKGILTLYFQFAKSVQFTDSSALQSTINITLNKYRNNQYSYEGSQQLKRLLQVEQRQQASLISSLGTALSMQVSNSSTSYPQNTNQSSRIINESAISFTIVYKSSNLIIIELFPQQSILSPSFIKLSFITNSNLYIIDKVSKIPLQQNNYIINIEENQVYQAYNLVKSNSNTSGRDNKFAFIGEIVVDFIFIIALVLVMFNRYAKIYHLLTFVQSIFMIVCLDINMPPNLLYFLQGFRYSHFYQFPNFFISSSSPKKITDFSSINFNRIESIFNDINFLVIIGHLISLHVFVLIVFVVMYLINKFLSPSSKYITVRNQYLIQLIKVICERYKCFKWSYITDVYLSTFMLMLAAFFFQMINYEKGTNIEQPVGIALSYIYLLIMMSYSIYHLYKNYKIKLLVQNQPQKFVSKQYMYRQDYISFFQGISSPNNLYKNYLLTLKLIVYGFFGGVLWNYPNFTLSIWIMIELIYAMIYLFQRPYSDENQNYLYSISSILLSISMILVIILNQYGQISYKEFMINGLTSQKQIQILQNKSLMAYFVIVLMLICVFILIVEMIVSIMRGNLNRKKLEGQQQEDNNQNKPNSPKHSIQNKKSKKNRTQIENVAKKIYFQEKKEYVGYSIKHINLPFDQQFLYRSVSRSKNQ